MEFQVLFLKNKTENKTKTKQTNKKHQPGFFSTFGSVTEGNTTNVYRPYEGFQPQQLIL